MNLRKLKNQAGFTLVELIVVIAIMAILAGVAVPVYSGYIEKAEKAGDLQLLGAVNGAFAAACVENDTDVHKVESEQGTPKITSYTEINVNLFEEDFQRYFAGNEVAFKYFDGSKDKQLIFSNGAFRDPVSAGPDDGITTVTYAGQTLYVTEAQKEALANSTFGTEVGAAPLLGEVSALTKWADSDGNAILDVLGDDYYLALAGYMGFDDPQEFQDYLNDAQEKGTLTEDQINAMTTNGIVLYAAEGFAKLSNDDITTLLNADNIYAAIAKEDPATQLAQASLVYGLYTGYINSENYTGDLTSGSDDPVGAIKAVSEDAEFVKYINSAQGQADLNAYKSAMDVINSSSTNTEAITDVLLEGYDNQELIDLLDKVMKGSVTTE